MTYVPPNPPDFGPPPPGPRPFAHSGPETAPCTRCGHRARVHLDSDSCSGRVRWWRHCQCSGYTGFDVADPALPVAPDTPGGPRRLPGHVPVRSAGARMSRKS